MRYELPSLAFRRQAVDAYVNLTAWVSISRRRRARTPDPYRFQRPADGALHLRHMPATNRW